MPRLTPAQKAKPKKAPKTKAERLAKVEASGVSPLDIMVWNMRFYHRQAVSLTEEWQDGKGPARGALWDDMLGMRTKAQMAACDVAPYLHPRLSAAQVKATHKVVVEVQTIPPWSQRKPD